ncbi:hypothetical protein ACTJK5_21615 [Agrobacterium sp. 22094]|uniref:hypothetical protein n=1 Tax=Agrobacterium sp. 22094 TaxID=3453872 RepID=UPI003F83F0AD
MDFELKPGVTTVIALALVAVSTGLNMLGTKLLVRIAMFGFICELVGAIVVRVYLLAFRRVQPASIVFDTPASRQWILFAGVPNGRAGGSVFVLWFRRLRGCR